MVVIQTGIPYKTQTNILAEGIGPKDSGGYASKLASYFNMTVPDFMEGLSAVRRMKRELFVLRGGK